MKVFLEWPIGTEAKIRKFFHLLIDIRPTSFYICDMKFLSSLKIWWWLTR